MAVVNTKSNLFGDYLAGTDNPDPELARGRAIMATGSVSNGATDSNLSTYKLASLPSNCILGSRTLFDVENWGFATVNIGTKDDIDALITIAKASGNTVTPVVFGDAKHGKRLWEVLGLAADPGGMIDLYAHASADATGAGAMPFQFEYFFR
jgi:hypothetical protein